MDTEYDKVHRVLMEGEMAGYNEKCLDSISGDVVYI